MKLEEFVTVAAVVLLIVAAVYVFHAKVQCGDSGGVLVRGVIGWDCVQSRVTK